MRLPCDGAPGTHPGRIPPAPSPGCKLAQQCPSMPAGVAERKGDGGAGDEGAEGTGHEGAIPIDEGAGCHPIPAGSKASFRLFQALSPIFGFLWYALSLPSRLVGPFRWFKLGFFLLSLLSAFILGSFFMHKCQGAHYVLCDQSQIYKFLVKSVADCEVRYVKATQAVALASEVIGNPLISSIPQVKQLNSLKLDMINGAVRVSVSSLKGKIVMEQQLFRLAKSCGEASDEITKFAGHLMSILDDIDFYRKALLGELEQAPMQDEMAFSQYLPFSDSTTMARFRSADRNLAVINQMNEFAAYINTSFHHGARSASVVYDKLATVEAQAVSASMSVASAIQHEWDNFFRLKWNFQNTWLAMGLRNDLQAGMKAVVQLQSRMTAFREGTQENAIKFNVARELGAMHLELKALGGFEVVLQKAKVQAAELKELENVV